MSCLSVRRRRDRAGRIHGQPGGWEGGLPIIIYYQNHSSQRSPNHLHPKQTKTAPPLRPIAARLAPTAEASHYHPDVRVHAPYSRTPLLAPPRTSTPRYEAAADAVVAGDRATLGRLLRDDPELVRARSDRPHHATLLHYVSANGVEDARQITPPNAVEIATMLLDAHAEVDACADTYGGGLQQTTLNLVVSSVHPARARLQVPLLHALLDFGAAINGVKDDDSPLLTALAFQYPDAAQALAARGARADSILAAAGLGREDVVRQLVGANGALKPGVRLPPAPKLGLPQEPKAHLERALIWAAALGRTRVVDFLALQHVDLAATDPQGFTALHWAAFRGHLDVIDVLLRRGAPLDVVNVYGGTVLDTTLWAAAHVDGVFHDGGFKPVDYAPVLEVLRRDGGGLGRT